MKAKKYKKLNPFLSKQQRLRRLQETRKPQRLNAHHNQRKRLRRKSRRRMRR